MAKVQSPHQFSRYDGKNKFFEVMTSALPIDKVLLHFKEYAGADAGFRSLVDIDFYLSMRDVALIAADVSSGRYAALGKKNVEAAKAKAAEAGKTKFYPSEIAAWFGGQSAAKAGREDGQPMARVLRLSPGASAAWMLSVETGPGKLNDKTGGFMPAYSKPEQIIRIGITSDDLKALAADLHDLRSLWVSHRYAHQVGEAMARKNQERMAAYESAVSRPGAPTDDGAGESGPSTSKFPNLPEN